MIEPFASIHQIFKLQAAWESLGTWQWTCKCSSLLHSSFGQCGNFQNLVLGLQESSQLQVWFWNLKLSLQCYDIQPLVLHLDWPGLRTIHPPLLFRDSVQVTTSQNTMLCPGADTSPTSLGWCLDFGFKNIETWRNWNWTVLSSPGVGWED